MDKQTKQKKKKKNGSKVFSVRLTIKKQNTHTRPRSGTVNIVRLLGLHFCVMKYEKGKIKPNKQQKETEVSEINSGLKNKRNQFHFTRAAPRDDISQLTNHTLVLSSPHR